MSAQEADAQPQQPVVAETPASSGGQVTQREFSNENLLKMETHDKFSTAKALKKSIAKQLQVPEGQECLEGLTRVGKNPKNSIAFFAFSSEEARAAAKEKLEGLKYRQKQWFIMEIRQADLEVTHRKSNQKNSKRNRDDDDDQEGVSKVCPLAGVPYAEQLERKRKHCAKIYNTMKGHQNVRANPVKVVGDEAFQGIIASPVQDGYRNNVTLSFGWDKEGNKAIGFNAGSVLEGTAAIEPLDHVTVNPGVKGYADVVAQVAAGLDASIGGSVDVTAYYNKAKQEGFWRKLQVRNNVNGEFMLDVEFNLPEPCPEPMKKVIHEVIGPAMVKGMQALPTGLCSLQYHCYDGVSNASTELARHVLFGPGSLIETLCGRKFDVAPTAFFQVNIPATELMLDKVADLANLNKNTVLLDLCCGTGTIGICMADKVRKVIGVEMVPDSIENAKVNATRNNVENIEFHCGKVEDVLLPILQSLDTENASSSEKLDVVAILDPPRCGVHPDVVKWIRRNTLVHRMVYISCDQRALERDSEGFVKPPTLKFIGTPFGLQASMGVDLFPHTGHQEMFAVFQRVEAPAAQSTEVTDATPAEQASA